MPSSRLQLPHPRIQEEGLPIEALEKEALKAGSGAVSGTLRAGLVLDTEAYGRAVGLCWALFECAGLRF